MRRFGLGLVLAWCAASGAGAAAPSYLPAGSVTLGAPDRWDYALFDPASVRVFVAHGDRVTVVDARSGVIVGQVTGIGGVTHGVAISTATGQGITDDGRNGTAILFDLKTLQIERQIAADKDADAIARDAATGHIFVVAGDPGTITVIDPVRNGAVATIRVGAKMEYAASDDRGTLFVSGEEKRDLIAIDTRTNMVRAHFPAPDCESPHGLALDRTGHRAFMGCTNSKMMVFDTLSGRIVARLAIGRGSDAVAFDPVRKRVFSSNGLDGTVTVYQQTQGGTYTALAPVVTAVSGRTMTLDPGSGRLYVVAADTDPSATPGGRPAVRPGTLRLMMFDPAPITR